jgi:hypothetical protein
MTTEFSLERLDSLFSLGKQHEGIFWRHDVDYSPFAALKMAEFEAARGISATYYIFYDKDWPYYGPIWAHELLYELTKRGHDVGWHVDERKLSKEQFSRLCGRISFHCPTEEVLWKDFPHFTNAYASKWYGRYTSDSGGRFRQPPEMYIKTRSMMSPLELQINLHPEWWFEPNWADRVSDEEHRRNWYCEKPVR